MPHAVRMLYQIFNDIILLSINTLNNALALSIAPAKTYLA